MLSLKMVLSAVLESWKIAGNGRFRKRYGPLNNVPVLVNCTKIYAFNIAGSVTRLGDLMDFEQVFKAFDNS